MSELADVLADISANLDEFKTSHGERLDALTDRLEAIEAKGATPRKNGARRDIEHKEFHTANGIVYELPSHVKMADVLGPEKEPEISLGRWLGAAIAGEKCGDRLALEFAREQKQLVTTTTGVLIPAQYISRWIDLIRAQSVLNAAGMTTVTMEAKTQTSSAVTADPAATWHSEAGSISADNPTFASRSLTAQTLVVRCQASLELTQDSPDFGAQLANVMTRSMAAELDRVGLEGTGTPPEPRGVKNTSNVIDVPVGSPATLSSYAKLIDAVGELLAANNDLEAVTRAAVMNGRAWTALEKLVTGISGDQTQLMRPKALENTRFLVTGNVAGASTDSPPTTTNIYLGDWRDLVMGVRREATIDQLRLTTYASNLLVEFVGYLRGDFMVRRPTSFAKVSGISA